MKRGRSKSAPKYRLHKRSGQAVVSINGKDIYLGKHSTEESQQRYRAAIADHWASANRSTQGIDSEAKWGHHDHPVGG